MSSSEAFNEAGIYVRSSARQIVIDTGVVDTSDRSSPDLSDAEHDPPLPSKDSMPHRGGGKRQAVSSFSKRSRRRLRRWVHAIPRDVWCLFVTLTYHETDPSPEGAKEHLDHFCKRLRRTYPNASIVWKMEPQQRGVPHFHLLIYGVKFHPADDLSRSWHECTDEESKAHKKAGVDVERGVHNDDGKLQSYLAKYMNKEVDAPKTWGSPGRFWGIRGRENLPLGSWEQASTLTRAEAEALIYAQLDEWGVDLPEYTSIPSLTICTRGDPVPVISNLQ